jgi:tRNA dimethylallyltransferase
MIDIIRPEEEFNVYLFKKHFYEYFRDIQAKGKLPFLAGGTGLYISSVIQNYKIIEADFSEDRIAKFNKLNDEQLAELLIKLNPKQHNTTDLINRKRMIKAIIVEYDRQDREVKNPEINPLVIGIKLPREAVKEKITARLKQRLETGMVKEVENLIESGVSFERLFELGLEYKFVAMYLKGDLSFSEMFTKLNTAIHQYSKRQMTWFRKMEREGVNIHWIEGADFESARNIITSHL